MGILSNIITKLNNKRYLKIKEEYAKEAIENGYFPPIENIQKFISKNKISLMPKENKYGDEWDSIEEIFIDNEEIIAQIKNHRKNILIIKQNEFFCNIDNLSDDSDIFKSSQYKEFENEVFKFDDYYKKEKAKKSSKSKKIKMLEIIKNINNDEGNEFVDKFEKIIEDEKKNNSKENKK